MKDEIFNMTRAWDKEKSESPTGIEPMTSWTPGGLITTHDEFGSADPSCMQGTCHIWTQCSPWVLLAEWTERPPGVWEVMGSIPVGDSDFLCPTLVSSWIFHLSKTKLLSLACFLDLVDFRVGIPSIPCTSSSSSSWAISALSVVVATSFPGRFPWGGERVVVVHHADRLLPPFLTRSIQSS